MCGVVAVLGPRRHALELALLLLSHRGIRHKITDCASGYVGHVRLPIVGLGEDNDQPMWQPPWLLGFVGELLDFRDLDPSAECDAPLVQDLWHKSGPEGFTERDGFWGIAAINQDTDELHVFCDYLAQKPMYYRTDVPAAASEINALRPFGPVTLDKIYLGAVIKWGYCPELERTPFCEIKHVLPGEHVVLSPDGSLSRRIADPLVPVGTPSHGLLYREMDKAVRRRMAATDVPVACLLSGGVDSAIVYTLAACYGTVKPYYVSGQDNRAADVEYWNAVTVLRPPAMTVTRPPTGEPELVPGLARSHYTDVTAAEALEIMQEPIDLGSLRPQVALSLAVKERVCLTGDGADELFGGYSRSQEYDSQYSDVFQELPAWHLPRLDRVMMHNKIEVRSPFLARRVAQLALGLPHGCRKDKSFLRDTFRPILPTQIADAPKKALRTPEIEQDRKTSTIQLVNKFVEDFQRANPPL